MKVGDLVIDMYDGSLQQDGYGVVTCIDPEVIGDDSEVEVAWANGQICNHSTCFLYVLARGGDK